MRAEVTFVLSAGRTGTVFLTRTLPAHVPGLHCVHEPPGSRGTLVLGNLRNLAGSGTAAVRRRFRAGLEARLAAVPPGHRYVEINPMLCPVTDLVAELAAERPVALVHLVREPASWVRSIRAFRASGRWRHVIDHLPLGTPFPVPRPRGWLATDQTSRALWRWRYCNEQILALHERVGRSTVVRHEDLFAADADARRVALLRLLEGLGVPAPAALDPLLDAPPANPAPAAAPVDVDPADVQRICGPVMAALGYGAQAERRNNGAAGGSDRRSSDR